MALTRLYQFDTGTTLAESDIEGEFDQIYGQALSLISPLTGNLAAGGNDITGVDELGFTDATANATAAARIRVNADSLTFHDGTAARNLLNATSLTRVEFVRKTANETVNNSNTLQNDDTLLVALSANEVVAFMCFIIIDSGTTPDFQAAFTVPAAATLAWGQAGLASQNTASAFTYSVAVTVSGTAVAMGGVGAGSPMSVMLVGTVANGANAGNLQLQWAQNTANASDTIVYANSWLVALRV